jgi:hypothetical protein
LLATRPADLPIHADVQRRIDARSQSPAGIEGCHTTLIGDHVIEGHAVDLVKRLLSEKSPIKVVSLPGMPSGSPGMVGEKAAPFTVCELSDANKGYAIE